ncbi:MAG: ribosome-associated translation inhibitor RaiA [Beijerinckiaceae bacterium]|nr:ribosome-associated translation inhibitor RaiA [Beijerinckiaceae bacterium]
MAQSSPDGAITIGSSNVDLGDALRAHVHQEIEAAAKKYLQNLTLAAVHFAHEGSSYRCSVTVQIGALPTMAAEAQSHDAYVAFNQALAKAAKQMRRAKRAVREDKPVRADKDASLREGLGRLPD